LIFAAFIFYGLGGTGLFVLRYRAKTNKRMDGEIPSAQEAPKIGFKVPGYPIVPAFFVLFCIGLVANSILERPKESGMGLLLMASGIPFYLYWNRKKKD